METVYASDLRKAIANGKDDPLFRAMWAHDGTEYRALVIASSEQACRRILRAALEVEPESIRALTEAEMFDDELVNEESARCLQLDGYYLYEQH